MVMVSTEKLAEMLPAETAPSGRISEAEKVSQRALGVPASVVQALARKERWLIVTGAVSPDRVMSQERATGSILMAMR